MRKLLFIFLLIGVFFGWKLTFDKDWIERFKRFAGSKPSEKTAYVDDSKKHSERTKDKAESSRVSPKVKEKAHHPEVVSKETNIDNRPDSVPGVVETTRQTKSNNRDIISEFPRPDTVVHKEMVVNDSGSKTRIVQVKGGNEIHYNSVYKHNGKDTEVTVYDPMKEADSNFSGQGTKTINARTGKTVTSKSKFKYKPIKPIYVMVRNSMQDTQVLDSNGRNTGKIYEENWVKCKVSVNSKNLRYEKGSNICNDAPGKIYGSNPFACRLLDNRDSEVGRKLGTSPLCGQEGVECGDPCPARSAVYSGATLMKYEPWNGNFQILEWGNNPNGGSMLQMNIRDNGPMWK